MAKSLRGAAESYEGSKVEHIETLERISVDMEIETKTFGQGEGEFTIDVVTVDNKYYRVPASVLAQLQAHLEKKSFDFFSVLKTGSTKQDTKYTVVPEY